VVDRVADDVGASPEHLLLRATLRDFAAKRITPRAQQIHRGDHLAMVIGTEELAALRVIGKAMEKVARR
jgi:hypothetical protein